MDNVDEIRQKLFESLDPNNDYSQEDFMKEYGEPKPINTSLLPKIALNFVNKSDNQDPTYATEGSSGFDIRASEDVIIEAGSSEVIPTGLFFDIPPNFEIQIRPRSGLAAKNGVTVLNSPGTIDSDYTGEIKVILINHGDKPFDVAKGDRIAQAVISTVTAKNIIQLNKVSKIEKDTERGTGGFGSTGLR